MMTGYDNISGAALVFGIMGDPIEHSMSPLIQNAALRELGLDAVYVPFHVSQDSLGDAIAGVRALNIRGVNVTVPHKVTVMDHIDDITPGARAVGAVNTLVNDHGRLIGDNTDVYGFMACVSHQGGLDPLPEHVCVLGAGGAARAVVYGCAMREEVGTVTIVNRTVAKAERIAADISPLVSATIRVLPADDAALRETLATAGLVVNTTSLGMHPHEDTTPVPDVSMFVPGQAVCDIVYNPLQTRFLREAIAQGARGISGLAMLAYQGARALELWTGREAPVKTMLAVLRESFQR